MPADEVFAGAGVGGGGFGGCGGVLRDVRFERGELFDGAGGPGAARVGGGGCFGCFRERELRGLGLLFAAAVAKDLVLGVRAYSDAAEYAHSTQTGHANTTPTPTVNSPTTKVTTVISSPPTGEA